VCQGTFLVLGNYVLRSVLPVSDATAAIELPVRAGSRVLSVFENPLNTRILRAHIGGPKRLAELQTQVGWSAQSTVRAAVTNLCEVGGLSKRPVGESTYAVATTLSPIGDEMLLVADEVEAWLARCPQGPIAPESDDAKVAVKALAGGWSSTLMRALVSGPFTVTELSNRISDISYPSLERRIAWMRTTRSDRAGGEGRPGNPLHRDRLAAPGSGSDLRRGPLRASPSGQRELQGYEARYRGGLSPRLASRAPPGERARHLRTGGADRIERARRRATARRGLR
jgi:DNA-binding HxlR family transcriptional regulator